MEKKDFALNVEDGSAEIIRCRRCRAVLATVKNVVQHEAGIGETAFDWRKRAMLGVTDEEEGDQPKPKLPVPKCSSVFIEPLDWLEGIWDTVDGQIACFKCSGKLGNYSWVGKKLLSFHLPASSLTFFFFFSW